MFLFLASGKSGRTPEPCPNQLLHARININRLIIIQFAIGVSLLAATIVGSATDSAVTTEMVADPKNQIQIESPVVEEGTREVQSQPQTTQEIVQEYFSDTPILIDVARCESRFRQFDATGAVLRGKVNPRDIGVMQINEKYHATSALKYGFDIYSLEGNLGYAKHLYEKQGTSPWVHSSKCWNGIREVAIAK